MVIASPEFTSECVHVPNGEPIVLGMLGVILHVHAVIDGGVYLSNWASPAYEYSVCETQGKVYHAVTEESIDIPPGYAGLLFPPNEIMKGDWFLLPAQPFMPGSTGMRTI